MNDAEVRQVVQDELSNIAPEADFSRLRPSDDLRDALDIDSMDFLNFITAIHKRLGVDIPEPDYPRLITLDGAVQYLQSKLQAVGR